MRPARPAKLLQCHRARACSSTRSTRSHGGATSGFQYSLVPPSRVGAARARGAAARRPERARLSRAHARRVRDPVPGQNELATTVSKSEGNRREKRNKTIRCSVASCAQANPAFAECSSKQKTSTVMRSLTHRRKAHLRLCKWRNCITFIVALYHPCK